ncbi:hypothetical protein B0O79_2731 [Flavobacteriaceae bacterium MAR_2009_75]|nr:hypothetical protein B0O79_2731 [Flavobacteriaceae bacterium MAR_2009_75]
MLHNQFNLNIYKRRDEKSVPKIALKEIRLDKHHLAPQDMIFNPN